MSFIAKLKNIILPKPVSNGTTNGKNKVSLVIDELVYAFEESLERMMTPRSLMFHTAYVVYVPKSYYKEIHLAFGIITQEVTEIFHEKLNDLLKRNRSLRFTPLFDSWSFDIISLGEDTSDTPDEDNPDSAVTYEELEEKFVAVRSFPVPNEMYNFNLHSDDDEVMTNRSQPNSKFNSIQRLSIGAIRGLKPSGNGYTYPINLNGGDVTLNTTQANDDRVLAVLKSAEDGINFLDNQGARYKSIDVRLSCFFLGGKSASTMYQGKPMVRIDSEAVLCPHCEIRQDGDGAFYIRPIGIVEQGQIPMKKNEWARLSDRNASLKLNGNIELIFNKK